MSSEKNDSFFPKSNAFKSILNKPKEEKKSFGKEEFLARRKFFLQKLENEGGIPKPKPLINNSTTKKKTSNEKIKTTYQKSTTPTVSTSHIKSTPVEKEKTTLPEKITLPEWSVSSAKSESLKKIIDLAGKKDTNTVGKNVFNARQKFFADSQLSSVDQLMPRPSTPPGFCYFERCPSPSIEPRRNSYSIYTSSSPSLNSASILPSSPTPIIAPSPKPAPATTYSLPWEHGKDNKKNIVEPKPKSSVNVIESLEKIPLVSEITLPEPVKFTKETLQVDEPLSVRKEKVEAINPMVAKIIVSLPEPIQFTKVALSTDEPLTVETSIVEMPEMNIPKTICILPKPVSHTKELLPQDKPLEIEKVNIVAEEMKIPEKVYIVADKCDDVNNELKSDAAKTMDISSLTLESNIEEKKENRKSIDKSLNNYTNENQPLIDNNSETSESADENKPLLDFNDEITTKNKPLIDFNDEIIDIATENEPLLDFDNNLLLDNGPSIDFNTESFSNNITENTLISFDDEHDNEIKNKKTGSISELLNSNGTLSLDEPLPIKSIPTYGENDNTVNDLIDSSDSDNLSDKVKNWYTVVDNAISNEQNKN